MSLKMHCRIVSDIVCLLDVFRSIPGIQERGVAFEDTFRNRFLYDQKQPVQIPLEEEDEEEIPLFTKEKQLE